MTQTGTLWAISGSGGPKLGPLLLAGAVASHTGLELASHPLRQSFRNERCGTGKLWEMPVHPLSRSVPDDPVSRHASSGPPLGFGLGQSNVLHVPVEVPLGGLQMSFSESLSFLPLLPAAETLTVIFPGFFFPFFVVLSATLTSLASAHDVLDRSVGIVSVAPAGFDVTVGGALSGAAGVHCVRAGSVWFGQTAIWNAQTPFSIPSPSQVGSPSAQVILFELLAAPVTSNST